MQAVSENLYRRGKRGTYDLRRRIPTPPRDAYPPGKVEISCSLRTSDYGLAKQRLHTEMSAVDAQFVRQKIKLAQRWNAAGRPSQHVTHLSDQQVRDLADNDVHCVLESDEAARRDGLDECDFEALGSRSTGAVRCRPS